MNLAKLIDINDTGFEVGHWFLEEINHNRKEEKILIVYVGYKTKQDRLDGKNPVEGAVLRFAARNFVDENEVEQNEYDDFATNGYINSLSQRVLNHIRNTKVNTILADSVND